jgi:hypothetical protein
LSKSWIFHALCIMRWQVNVEVHLALGRLRCFQEGKVRPQERIRP